MLLTILTIAHVIICLLLILVVLLQSGKGASIGAIMGGASQTIFGGSGGHTFFYKFTIGLAVAFLANSLMLAWVETNYKPTTALQEQLKESIPKAPPVSSIPPSVPLSQDIKTPGTIPMLTSVLQKEPAKAETRITVKPIEQKTKK